MLGTALTASGVTAASKLLADPLSGSTPDPLDLCKNLLTALPLGMGLPLPIALSGSLASQHTMGLLAGSLPQPEQALVAGAFLASGGMFTSMTSRSLFGLAVTATAQLIGGNIPDAASLGKDIFVRSPWLLASLINPASLPISKDVTKPSIMLPPSPPPQRPWVVELPDWLAPFLPGIPPIVITCPPLPEWPNLEDRPFSDSLPVITLDGNPIEPDDTFVGQESWVFPVGELATDKLTPENKTSRDEGIISREALEYFKLQDNPYMEQVTDKLCPPVADQFDRGDPFIVTDMSPPTTTHTQDDQGNPILRHRFEQRGLNADVLQQDHWQNLIDRLRAGESISWDHLALAMLSALSLLSADMLLAISSKVPLFSSALQTRTVTMDVSLKEYNTVQELPSETIESHDTVTINQPGKDIVTDKIQRHIQHIAQNTTTYVYTYDITISPVPQTGANATIGEPERKTFSYAKQEHAITTTVDTQNLLTATLQDGKSATAATPVHRTTQQHTQWTTFEMEGDLRPLAQQGAILDSHLQQNPEIQLVSFSQNIDEHSEVAEPHTVAHENPILDALLADALAGRNTLTDRLGDLVQSLDTGSALRAQDSMVGSSSSTSTSTTEHGPVQTVLSENLFFDDIETKKTTQTTTNTQQKDIVATQIVQESYTLHTGEHGTKVLDRSDKTINTIIQEYDTTTVKVDECSETTLSKYGKFDTLVGNASEVSPTTSTTKGSQAVTTYRTNKDVTAALQDGVLTPEELNALQVEQIDRTFHDIDKHVSTDASNAGRTFNEGLLTYIPIVGSAVDMTSKSSYDFEISACDILFAAVDVGVTVATLGTGSLAIAALRTSGKVAVKQGLKAGAKQMAKQAPKIGTMAAKDIGQAMEKPFIMAAQGIKFAPQLISTAQKANLGKLFGKAAGSLTQAPREIGTAYKKYTDEALDYARDTYHKLNNAELSLKEFPRTFFKDMSVNNPAWQALVKKNNLSRLVHKNKGITYTTDKYGRPKGVFTKKLTLQPAVRDIDAQNAINKLGKTGDDAGHLIGKRFGGEAGPLNLVPQNANLNRGAWKRMENSWERALKGGKSVDNVSVRPHYDGDSLRPYKFEARYRIDGKNYVQTFYNTKV